MMEDWIFDSHNGATLHFRKYRVRDGLTDIFDLFNSGPRRPPGRRQGRANDPSAQVNSCQDQLSEAASIAPLDGRRFRAIGRAR